MKPAIHQKFIVGNWKMYTIAPEAGRLAKAIVDGMDDVSGEDACAFIWGCSISSSGFPACFGRARQCNVCAL
jgi:hypothetical protein